MIKRNLFKRITSLVLALVLCFGLMQPVLSSAAEAFSDKSTYYVALGDGMTYGIGLAEGDKSYVKLVAEALGMTGKSHSNSRYRVEELRYLLDDSYSGDGYTNSFAGLAIDREDGAVKEMVQGAAIITINVGVNNFSTYIVEQMMYYMENDGAVKYAYDFDDFASADVVDAMETVQAMVLKQFKAAAPDAGDQALDMINYVTEVATYAVLSYTTSMDALVEAIEKLNPNAKLYIVGLYNPAQGEVLSFNYHGVEKNVPIGEVFGALTEMANAYIQILANRRLDYIYVDPGMPELLIDQLGNTKLTNEDRVPGALKLELLDAAEDTAVGMVQEMFDAYGIKKTYKQALAIVEEIFGAANDAAREEYVRSLLSSMVVDEVLVKFETELEDYAGTYGDIDIQRADIEALLTDLDNAADIAAREGVATEFVEDLMTKAMIGQTFAGMYIATQEDAYEAIELLERNSEGDPDALREAAADMIMAKVGENGLKDFISRDDVLDLLLQLDTATTSQQRELIIKNWMNDLAVEKITNKIKTINPAYTTADAEALMAAMEADPANAESIAKNHMLTTGGFHNYMVAKFAETYTANGLTLKTYTSFEAFVTAVETAATNADAEAIVRNEIRAAAAVLVAENAMFQMLLGASSPKPVEKQKDAEDIANLFAAMDVAADPREELINTLVLWLESTYSFVTTDPVCAVIISAIETAYTKYNNAATAAETAVSEYRDGVNEAAEAFAQYVELKDDAAAQILNAYETSYKGAGETALQYYTDYLNLRAAAVEKVMDGYEKYLDAIETGMKSCDQLNDKFEEVFDLLCEIGEVEVISLNDLVSVAKKVTSNKSYVSEMVDNLIQGDDLASDDKTVAYVALRYYLAGSMMIMPSAKGHQEIAANIIKAHTTGKDVHSTEGYWANKIIDGTLNVFRSAKAFWQSPTSASGQASTIINPKSYVALGGNITTGSDTYVDLLGKALAMADDQYDDDIVYNLALDGLRAEDLLVLVNNNYAGDAYTDGRFGEDYLESLRGEYQAAIESADLITIEVGINNLVTYPMTQTLLAYNGDEVYEMDWGQYIGEHRETKLENGKDAMFKLMMGIVNDDAQCEKALRTVSTAVESLVYSLIGYIFHLDDAVESIAELNEDATIALVGFYNPMNDTYIRIDREVTVAGHSVDLSEFNVNVSAIFDKVIDIGNRYLANYVGNTKEYGNANDANSRLLNVKILDTELKISDYDISKDLSVLADYKNITVNGKSVMLKVPEYFLKAGQTAGEALHPNANGHLYIRNQILDALDFQIHADVYPEYNWKYYGDVDPELVYTMDDESSLYELVMDLVRAEGENVGFYDITATVVTNTGYYEVDTLVGRFEIKARPVTITVKQDTTITVGDALPTFTAVVTDTLTGKEITGLNVTITGVPADSNTVGEYTISATLNETNYVLAEEVTTATLTIEEEAEEIVEGTISIKTNSLSLESEVHYNTKFVIDGFDMNQVVEIGLLQFNEKTPNAADSVYANADAVYKWDGVTKDGDRYVCQTNGVPAALMGEDVWFKAYVKLVDGTYRYSQRTVYSAARYAKTVLENNYPTSLKALCVALMDYGTAAQAYFAEQGEYEYTTAMNAFLTAEHKSLVNAYSDSMINDRLPARYSSYGEFDTRCADIKTGSFSLSLLGAISLNAKNYTYTLANATETGFVFWDHETFAAQGELKWENASMIVPCDPDGSIEAALTGIAAAQMHETFVAVPYVLVDGQYCYGAVSRISIDYYAQKIIAGNYGATMTSLAQYMVVYGEYARAYFGN